MIDNCSDMYFMNKMDVWYIKIKMRRRKKKQQKRKVGKVFTFNCSRAILWMTLKCCKLCPNQNDTLTTLLEYMLQST